MASIKLDLVQNVWQDIGAIAFVGSKGTGTNIELVNADALPVGTVDAAFSFLEGQIQSVPAPAAGNWFVRTTASSGGVFKFTEVV